MVTFFLYYYAVFIKHPILSHLNFCLIFYSSVRLQFSFYLRIPHKKKHQFAAQGRSFFENLFITKKFIKTECIPCLKNQLSSTQKTLILKILYRLQHVYSTQLQSKDFGSDKHGKRKKKIENQIPSKMIQTSFKITRL